MAGENIFSKMLAEHHAKEMDQKLGPLFGWKYDSTERTAADSLDYMECEFHASEVICAGSETEIRGLMDCALAANDYEWCKHLHRRLKAAQQFEEKHVAKKKFIKKMTNH